MNLGGAVRINKTGFIILLLLIVLITYYYTNSEDTHKVKIKEINLRTLLSVVIKAAKFGGIEVVSIRNHLVIKSKGKTKEGANDSYTTADINSHCSMVAILKSHFPSVNLISEEHKTICDKDIHVDKTHLDELSKLEDEVIDENDVTVWIDPLDATQEYTETLYDYVTTMVCVAVKGKPIIGVIHNPFKNVTYWAWDGKGTSDNLQEKMDNNENQITRILISRSHAGEIKKIIKDKFVNEKIEIIEAGGAGYKVLQVATGKADVYLHVTAIKKWDICAGNAILNSLGGKLSTKNDDIVTYGNSFNVVNEDGVIASLKHHEKFVGKL